VHVSPILRKTLFSVWWRAGSTEASLIEWTVVRDAALEAAAILQGKSRLLPKIRRARQHLEGPTTSGSFAVVPNKSAIRNV